MNDYEQQTEIANQAAKATANIMFTSYRLFQDPKERLTFVMGIGLVSTTQVMEAIGKMGERDFTPNNVLLAHLVQANSVYFCHQIPGKNSAGFGVEFDIANIIKAMDQFKVLTGREAREIMNESLIEIIDSYINESKSAFTGDLDKFLPN